MPKKASNLFAAVFHSRITDTLSLEDAVSECSSMETSDCFSQLMSLDQIQGFYDHLTGTGDPLAATQDAFRYVVESADHLVLILTLKTL